jgi:hypothetical protein
MVMKLRAPMWIRAIYHDGLGWLLPKLGLMTVHALRRKEEEIRRKAVLVAQLTVQDATIERLSDSSMEVSYAVTLHLPRYLSSKDERYLIVDAVTKNLWQELVISEDWGEVDGVNQKLRWAALGGFGWLKSINDGLHFISGRSTTDDTAYP